MPEKSAAPNSTSRMLRVNTTSTVNGMVSNSVGMIDTRATNQVCKRNSRQANGGLNISHEGVERHGEELADGTERLGDGVGRNHERPPSTAAWTSDLSAVYDRSSTFSTAVACREPYTNLSTPRRHIRDRLPPEASSALGSDRQ